MGAKRKTGGNTSTIETSPSRRRRQTARRKAQEAAWAARSGPVTVVKVPPTT